MKTYAPLASLAILLAACGGSNTDSPAAKSAPLAMRSLQGATHEAAGYVKLTQNLYIGFFGRAADAQGLDYWTNIFSDKNLPLTFPEWVAGYGVNADITAVLDAFASSVETQDLYVSNNASFINAIYQNGFNRYAEIGGRDYWAGQINSGAITRAQAVLSILSSAQGTDGDILTRKTQAAVTLTSLLNSDFLKLAYATGGYNDGARELLGRITATTDLAAFRADIVAFVTTLETSDSAQLVVRRYAGYHYLQDAYNVPLYAAGYRYLLGPNLPPSGELTYGADPQTIGWTRSDVTGYVYAAPFTASAHITSSNRLPAMSMLCAPVVTANGAVTRSTDVLVARNAVRLASAAQLAKQEFTVYRENCAIGGSNLKSFKFDADGNGLFPVASGTMTFDTATVTGLLKGDLSFDLSTGKYLSFAAYQYLRTDGQTGYFIVQHLANRKTGVSDGVLAVWSQE